MGAAVLLLHELPDGTSHYDWLITPDGPRASGGAPAGLISFRVSERIDLLGGGGLDGRGALRFGALRLPEHRAAYLDLEGEVSGGRGRVKRLARGELAVNELADQGLRMSGRLGLSLGAFRGRCPAGDGVWEFEFDPSVNS
jgi:hypothetical protein